MFPNGTQLLLHFTTSTTRCPRLKLTGTKYSSHVSVPAEMPKKKKDQIVNVTLWRLTARGVASQQTHHIVQEKR